MTASPTTSHETVPAEPLRFANAVEVTSAVSPEGMVYVTFYAHVPDPDSGDYHREHVARIAMTCSAARALKAALNEHIAPAVSADAENAQHYGINLKHDPVLRAIWDNDEDAAYDEL